MSAISEIKEQLNDLVTFKHISSAFTEASAVKLANIRKAFARNDRFFTEITHIYHLVKANAQKAQIKKENEVRQEKKLSVALTSNQRFFGHLNNAIMLNFLLISNKFKTDRLVIGATGDSYIRGSNYKDKYQSIIFSTDTPNPEESKSFMNQISQYTDVTIFFPKFISIIKQEVGSVDITGKIPSVGRDSIQELKEDINIIFEPELSKILKFFESEVRMILFKRVLLETDLARTAARLLEMSQAEERTDFEIKVKISELRKVARSIANAQLLETFSGIKKWKHGISSRGDLTQLKNKLLFFEKRNAD